ncbi:MAG TPA: bZIP transcription factor [Puia sp.]|nr:bZIP transcription factor [Puia sp.]
MPVFDFTINIVVFFVSIGLAMLVGFGLRSRQLIKKKRQIAELEKEMLQVSAEILQVQKEYCELEMKLKNLNIPVIPMSNRTA